MWESVSFATDADSSWDTKTNAIFLAVGVAVGWQCIFFFSCCCFWRRRWCCRLHVTNANTHTLADKALAIVLGLRPGRPVDSWPRERDYAVDYCPISPTFPTNLYRLFLCSLCCAYSSFSFWFWSCLRGAIYFYQPVFMNTQNLWTHRIYECLQFMIIQNFWAAWIYKQWEFINSQN